MSDLLYLIPEGTKVYPLPNLGFSVINDITVFNDWFAVRDERGISEHEVRLTVRDVLVLLSDSDRWVRNKDIYYVQFPNNSKWIGYLVYADNVKPVE